MTNLLIIDIGTIYKLFSFAMSVWADCLSLRIYSNEQTFLAYFSCFLVMPDDHKQPLKYAHTSAVSFSTIGKLPLYIQDKLSPSPVPRRQCQTFLTSSSPFGRENATKCEKVAVVISPVHRHFLVQHWVHGAKFNVHVYRLNLVMNYDIMMINRRHRFSYG